MLFRIILKKIVGSALLSARQWYLLCICLCPIFLVAQTYPVRHFTLREGLPSMTVRCVYKDTRSIMWIGTDAGLCTFDGKIFKVFKPADGMTGNQIWAIVEDEFGNIWIGSHGEGIFKYDGRNFERFTQKNGLADDRIRTLCYSKNFHCLLAGSEGGLNIIRGKTITSSPGEIFNSKSGACVTGLFDTGKFIYVTSYGQHNPVKYYPGSDKYISLNDKGTNYPDYSFSGYLSSKGDTVFSFQKQGVSIFSKGRVINNAAMGQVCGISEDKAGNLWFAAWSYQNLDLKGGIFRYDGEAFRNYKTAFGITDKEIWTVFCDKEQDVIWIGTINEGLYMVTPPSITNFKAAYFNIEKQQINDVFIDSGNRIWIAGSQELITTSRDGHFSRVNKHSIVLAYRNYLKTHKGFLKLPLDSVRRNALSLAPGLLTDFEKRTEFNFNRVIEEKDHSFLFSNEFGIFNLNEKSGQITFISPEGSLGDFLPMGDTLIYTGMMPTTFKPGYRKCLTDANDPNYFPASLFSRFTKEGNPQNVKRLVRNGDQYWYATSSSGLWMSRGDKLIHFDESDSTISQNVNDICFDKQNHVFFGTNTGEICIGTFSGKEIKIEHRINSDRGLQGSSIHWLLADQEGKLWVGTNLGLNCIDLPALFSNEKLVLRFLDERVGYNGRFSKHAVMDSTGNLWMGAGELLIKFDTRTFLSNPALSGRIMLKSIEINHEPADSTLGIGIDLLKSQQQGVFEFSHSQNDLVFYFDIFNYVDPSGDKFRYMLEGYDKTWRQWATDRQAIYTNLPPGQYTLNIEAYNLRTFGEIAPLKIRLIILHAWWQLWYVIFAGVTLMLALIAFAISRYLESERNKQRNKSEIEKKIVQLEIQALQAQMNPHFIFNCVSGIQYYVLSKKPDEVLVYLSDFSKVVRQTLGNTTFRLVNLEQEIDFLHSYLRLVQMRFPDKFDYEIICADKDSVGIIMFPPMVVQPFVENAIRHGFVPLDRMGHLSIVFEVAEKDLLKVIVTDDGVGRELAQSAQALPFEDERPHSTKITEARIRLFNTPEDPAKYRIVYTDLYNNGEPYGLMVELYLPMERGNNRRDSTISKGSVTSSAPY
jgi:ligand-binding sensor domain-containing protein